MSWFGLKLTLFLQEKIASFELGHQKKVSNQYNPTLEIFLQSLCLFLFYLANDIFNILTKNIWKIIKMVKFFSTIHILFI